MSAGTPRRAAAGRARGSNSRIDGGPVAGPNTGIDGGPAAGSQAGIDPGPTAGSNTGIEEDPVAALARLEAAVHECRRCPRLVAWREQVAREKRAAFRDETYWGRPIAGFGDPHARVVLLGLAPAAHGANRTGRVFTGDRSGDFLFAALHRTGFANQPTGRQRDDGLRLRDCWITASVRCAPPANKPLPSERDNCADWLRAELPLLERARVIVCLGAFAWESGLRQLAPTLRPRPRFAHGAEARVGDLLVLGCFHPSQQNTFTGVLTPAMLDAVLERARALADQALSPSSTSPA